MANVSHGRGDAANIGPDDTPYTDGEIVREGPVGNQGDGPYSTGRGGVGNIDPDGQKTTHPHDTDVIPETATKISKEESHHVGRGGAGNEAHVHEKKNQSIADKIKGLFSHKS